MSNIVKIVKHYGRKISKDYSSWDFSTSLEKEFDKSELDTKEKFLAESEKLFGQAKAITELDIEKYKNEMNPQVPKDATKGWWLQTAIRVSC